MSSPVPAKSQPLHNFSLPLLKWQKNDAATNHHHRTGRRLAASSPPPDSTRRHSPAWRQSPLRGCGGDSASESESGHAPERHRKKPTADVTDHVTGQSERKMAPTDHVTEKSKLTAAAAVEGDGGGVKEGKSKIYIRLRGKNKCDDVVQNDVFDKTGGGEAEDVGKSWNLRPRKPMRKLMSNGVQNDVVNNNRGFSQQQQQATKENRQEVVIRTAEEKKKEKDAAKEKFSIALTRQEIEEDIFVMTGSKPARRPRKRAKVVQKQIDNVFPGMWLAAITPDSYKVSEAPAKV